MASNFNRREFALAAGGAAMAAASSATGGEVHAQTAPAGAQQKLLSFPSGFKWGVATSAFQIEGAVNEDGRGPSIWDTYTRRPGQIKNGDTADIANDHYHRYREDVALMKEIGAQAYRFSIAWPRVFPSGTGEPNAKGIDFYDRLVDALLAAGITPFPTLYHWDLPQALQDKGGWQSRDTAKALGDYAAYVSGKLGDRVKNWFTVNEFYCFVDLSYQTHAETVDGNVVYAGFAPGLMLSNAALNQVRHNAVLAQGLAVQAIRANAGAGAKCGPADNLSVAVPAIETPEHIRAAEIATREMNAPYLTVMLEGKYTDAYLAAAGKDAPRVTGDDLGVIGTPVDFIGINVYRPTSYVMASGDPPGYKAIPFNASHPKMLSPWHLLGPEAIYWAPRHVNSLWGARDVYITENGCGASDVILPDGNVFDSDRVMFLRNHLMQLQRATTEGLPVKGYFHWSLMDNFEWNDGLSTRFGLVYVDYKTQKRIPKLSAQYFREAATRNAVV